MHFERYLTDLRQRIIEAVELINMLINTWKELEYRLDICRAIRMMRIIAERTLEIDDELCICFIDWQKAFDRVNWTKLMQILKISGIDWRERRLISKLYMNKTAKVRLDRGETRSVQIGRGVRQGCCLSPILFNLYSEFLTKEALDGLGDFKIGGQIIQTVKYADDLVLMVKEEMVLQGMIHKLIEIGRCYGWK